MQAFALAELHLPPDPADVARKAARIVAEAEGEAASIRQAAHAEGWAAGEAAAHAELDAQLALVRAAVDAVAAWQEGAEERFTRDAAELALAVAEKLVAGAVDVDPEVLERVIRRALRRVRARGRLTVIENPDDLETTRELLPRIATALGGAEVAVADDRRVARGGCLLDTPAGEIDGTVASQLERAREAIRTADAT